MWRRCSKLLVNKSYVQAVLGAFRGVEPLARSFSSAAVQDLRPHRVQQITSLSELHTLRHRNYLLPCAAAVYSHPFSTDRETDGAGAEVGSASTFASADFEPSIISQAVDAAEVDAWVAAAADCWFPTVLVENLLQMTHGTGLPWVESIVLTTLALRLGTLPFMLKGMKNTYKMSLARPEMEKLVAWMKEEQARGNARATEEYQARVAQIWQKYDCNPLKSLGSLFIQAPVFICFFAAIRHIAAAQVPSWTNGGYLWFTDLTAADPFYALPVLCSLSFLVTVELGAADGMQGQTQEMMSRMKNIMRFVAVALIPFTADMPMGLFVYWITSNIFSLAQSLTLKMPGVKKALGLPDLSHLQAKPTLPQQSALPVQTFVTRPRRKPLVAGK